MSKAYKPQRIGGSIYLCIPPSFFSTGMHEKGVKIELLEKKEREGFFIIKVKEAERENGEYNLNIEAGGEDSQELRATINIRKDGGFV